MLDCAEGCCKSCGTPLTGRQEKSCSGRCRAALSRRMRAEAQDERDQRMRQAVELLQREIRPSRIGCSLAVYAAGPDGENELPET